GADSLRRLPPEDRSECQLGPYVRDPRSRRTRAGTRNRRDRLSVPLYMAGGTGLQATLPGWAQEGGREKMLERLHDPAQRARMKHDIEANIEVEKLLGGATFDGVQIASVPPDKDQSILGKRLSQIAAERGKDN